MFSLKNKNNDMTIAESYNLDSPLTFTEWRKIASINKDFTDYTKYIQNWYSYKENSKKNLNRNSLKEEYKQLLNDLINIFDEQEKKIIFDRINLNKDEDILKVIPYCAKKLKEITQKLNTERKNISHHIQKIKHLGSPEGVENELRSFVLKNYTSDDILNDVKENLVSRSEISNHFNIKIEELYEEHPKMDLQFTTPQELSLGSFEFSNQNDLNGEVFILPKVAKTPLSSLFNKYLKEVENNSQTSDSLSLSEYLDLYVSGSNEFLGESQCGLDVIKVEDVYQKQIDLNFKHNNNWFYWPSGGVYTGEDDGIKGNHYEPININKTTLYTIAQAGDSYENSDLLFADKNGKIEAAWYKGVSFIKQENNLKLVINNTEFKEFVYPWVGYEVNSKTFEWQNYSLKELEPKIQNNLSYSSLQKLTQTYFTSYVNGCSAANSLFLNKSTLVNCGSFAGKNPEYGDVIIKSVKKDNVEKNSNAVEGVAFLYKFQHTNIPISYNKENNICWPLGLTAEIVKQQNPIEYTKEDVLPIALGHVNVSEHMSGAVAGTGYSTSDVIYKLKNSFDVGDIEEGAWLRGESITNLKGSSINKHFIDKKDRRGSLILKDFYDKYLLYPNSGVIEYNSKYDTYEFLETTYQDVPIAGMTLSDFILNVKKRDKNTWLNVYSYYQYISEVLETPYSDAETADTCCASYDGPIQPALAFNAPGGSYVSFVWCGPDTYADDVFRFRYHTSNCEYYKQGDHDYSKKTNYLDKSPKDKNDVSPWEKCTCRCVQYSPIGHSGKNAKEYNMRADLLFADPQMMGNKFNYKYWSDSRNYNASNSPQFAYFNLFNDDGYDKNLGFGRGEWKTGIPGKKFILQTGKIYTYKRSDLGVENNLESSLDKLYFIVQHPYVSIKDNKTTQQDCLINNNPDYNDVVLVIDQSLSMNSNGRFDLVYKSISSLIDKIIPDSEKTNNLLGLISVANTSTVLKGLTSRGFDIYNGIEQIKANIDSYNSIIQGSDSNEHLTLLKTGLNAAYEMLKNPLQLISKSLSVVNNSGQRAQVLYSKGKMECNNLKDLIDRQMPPLSQINDLQSNTEFLYESLPRNNANKKIILISDGENTGSWEELKTVSNFIKNNNVKIYCVDVNEIQSFNLQSICNSSPVDDSVAFEHYFHLRNFLNISDLTYSEFGELFYQKITRTLNLRPRWCKLVKTVDGSWVQSDEISDMMLEPGKYYNYIHQQGIVYTPVTGTTSPAFAQPTTTFVINLKLNGWDYNTNQFNPKEQINTGARPYWAQAYELSKDTYEVSYPLDYINFNKWSIYHGGHQRFVDYYMPIHQPMVSDMSFDNNCIYKYIHNGTNQINWNQPVTITSCVTSNEWKKLILSEEISNLKDLSAKKYSLLTHIVSATDIPSDLTFETYSNFKPVYYNYFRRSPEDATWSQPLQIKNWCKFLYSKLELKELINPIYKTKNTLNRNNITIAAKNDPQNTYKLSDVGGYMLPDKLKLSTFKETGAKTSINSEYILDNNDLFADPSKFVNESLGLSDNKNPSPMGYDYENSEWFIQNDFSHKNGKILNVKNNQTLYPYVTYYEEKSKNYGICENKLQKFWENGKWTLPEKYQPLKNGKISEQVVNDRLMDNENNENLGLMTNWTLDVNNIHYALIKEIE